MKKINVIKSCVFCGKHFEITLTEDQYKRYLSGERLAFDFPDLSRDTRHSLGLESCGDCWRREFFAD